MGNWTIIFLSTCALVNNIVPYVGWYYEAVCVVLNGIFGMSGDHFWLCYNNAAQSRHFSRKLGKSFCKNSAAIDIDKKSWTYVIVVIKNREQKSYVVLFLVELENENFSTKNEEVQLNFLSRKFYYRFRKTENLLSFYSTFNSTKLYGKLITKQLNPQLLFRKNIFSVRESFRN